MAYAVFVTFTIKPAETELFLKCMGEQAANSLALEEACRVFDAWFDSETPHTVHLYEVYDDAEGFQKHLDSEHFKSFDAVVAAMIETKSVTTCNQKLEFNKVGDHP